MHRFLCCSCFSNGNERQPLLQPRVDMNGARSARQTPSAHKAQVVRRINNLVMRQVCVPELDKSFSDMAVTFNEQQECYEAMARHISHLQQTYGCAHDDTLTFAECVKKIREEYEATYRVSLRMNGYDFSLNVVPLQLDGKSEGDPLPPRLQSAQDELRIISDRAKATISKGAPLSELTGWLLRERDQMAKQVKGAAASYQEQGRLNDNLEANMREVRRVKALSGGYRKRAEEVLTEAAQIAGT
ncbi:uncharacterized protein LOC113126565 [Mastacembelus armatus]|uniref:uncharacterized protein LOC113126565 n=1 Tax=Mastacembelus armatus TaxID=205130 RepID=UPI000E45904B|nr:uncharacterized protein LOC113126565 [Mastacembelus armatus]